MNILFFVNTPAQVHEFKYVAQTLEKKDNKVMILAQDHKPFFRVSISRGVH